MAQRGRCHVLSKIQGWRNGRGGIGILAVEGLILGTVATAIAIVLKLRRMDIPGMLRVLE